MNSVVIVIQLLSHVQFFVTSSTVALQAPLSMRLSRQEYWSGLPFPSPGDLPNPGIEPGSPTLQAESLPTEPQRYVDLMWSLKKCDRELDNDYREKYLQLSNNS